MLMDTPGQHANDTATAGVIARPPMLFLSGLLLGLALDRLLPLPFESPAVRPVYVAAGGLAILLGLAVFIAGIPVCRGQRRQYPRTGPRVFS